MTDKKLIGMVQDIPTLETIVSQRQQAVDASEPKEFDSELFRAYIRLSNLYLQEQNEPIDSKRQKSISTLLKAGQHYQFLKNTGSIKDRKRRSFYHIMIHGMADRLRYE